MTDSQSPGVDFDGPDLNLFDFDDYFGEQLAEPEKTPPSAVPPAPNKYRASDQGSSLEPLHERVSLSEAPSASFFEDSALIDTWDNSWGRPSMPAIDTGNEPRHRHEQQSSTASVAAELHQIDNELAEIELKLEHRRLQKRRLELLQILPTRQPIPRSEHPQFRNLDPAVVPSIECRMGQDYNGPISSPQVDTLQRTDPGIEAHYDVGFTNSNISSNPQETSSNLVASEQSGIIGAGILTLNTAQLPNSMPTPSTVLEHNRQYRTQEPISASSSDQTSTRPLSVGPQYGQYSMSLTSLVSTMSSAQHGQHIQTPEKSLTTKKRPRSPQPNMKQRLSAVQRLAKQTGAPQTSLDVMCFNPEPRPKRPRTDSQRQNKKDVQDAGGSCFLCLTLKKRVCLWNFFDLANTD